MINIRFCKNRKIDAVLKSVLLFILSVIFVFLIQYIKNEGFDYKKELIHSVEIVIKFCFILIVIDYIRIKLKR